MHGFLKSKAFRTKFLHKKSTGVKGYAGEIVLIYEDVSPIQVRVPEGVKHKYSLQDF
jgi:hypothetical protein